MKATLAAIADTASVGAGDKLTVQGVFDTIFAEVFPAVHTKMVLVVRLQLDPEDADREHSMRIRLVDSDGERLFEQRTRTQIGLIAPGEIQLPSVGSKLTVARFSSFVLSRSRDALKN